MNAGLTLVKWDEEVFNNDIYNNFTEKYSKLIEKHVPTKTVTIRPSDKPYITTAIRKRMQQRKRIHKKAVRTNNPQHWQQFRSIRNEIISLLRNAQRNYKIKLANQLVDKSIPPGKWWRIAKSVTRLKKTKSFSSFNCMSGW